MAARVGLTGGIGSGKSTVASLFADRGVLVIDADQVARKVVEPGTDCLDKIIQRYGTKILGPDHALDRKKLGEIVFSDTDERIWLEGLLHPKIREYMDKLALQSTDAFCILEIPLLIESNRHEQMDHVIIVHCDKKIRIQRLSESRGMTKQAVHRIVRNQVSDAERIAVADSVIDNSGDIGQLHPQVDQVFTLLSRKFSDPAVVVPKDIAD